MMYSKLIVPGASISTHPILPGRLKRESTEVFPMGYQAVSHWINANCARIVMGQIFVGFWVEGRAYDGKELPDELNELPMFPRRRHPRLDQSHTLIC